MRFSNSIAISKRDIDGVCIIPKEAEEEVFRLAIEKARGEKMVQKKIEEGMSAKEAFETYGIR